VGGSLVFVAVVVSIVATLTSDFPQAAVSTSIALVGAMVWFLKGDDSAVHESVVAVYPLGIQIGNRVVLPRTQSLKELIGATIFIPMEALIDCVVTEVVLSHKVISTLQFRVLCQPSGSALRFGSTTPMKLIPAFPGVELSYSECLTMRAEIHKCLLQQQSTR
jgi:hypothetical protein